MTSVWRVVASLLGAALALATLPAAANPPPVHLAVESCDSLEDASIRRIFEADLGAPTVAEVGQEVTEVSIACEGERVVVRVKDPLSRKTSRRSFDPKTFGTQATSRLIAIAASELVLASWAELAANPTPKVLAEGEPAKPETLATARGVVKARTPREEPAALSAPEAPDADIIPTPRPARSSRLTSGYDDDGSERKKRVGAPGTVFSRATAVLSMRAFLNDPVTLVGGGARIGAERYGVVSWALDSLVEDGQGYGHRLTSASLGGCLEFYARAGIATFRVGGGLRAGVLNSTLVTWGWPMLVTSHTLKLGPMVVDVTAEGGFIDLFVRRDPRVNRPGGPWISAQLGLGVVL